MQGYAKDGVHILKPAIKPDHFTYRQIVATVRKVKRARQLALDMLVSGITDQNRHGEAWPKSSS